MHVLNTIIRRQYLYHSLDRYDFSGCSLFLMEFVSKLERNVRDFVKK